MYRKLILVMLLVFDPILSVWSIPDSISLVTKRITHNTIDHSISQTDHLLRNKLDMFFDPAFNESTDVSNKLPIEKSIDERSNSGRRTRLHIDSNEFSSNKIDHQVHLNHLSLPSDFETNKIENFKIPISNLSDYNSPANTSVVNLPASPSGKFNLLMENTLDERTLASRHSKKLFNQQINPINKPDNLKSNNAEMTNRNFNKLNHTISSVDSQGRPKLQNVIRNRMSSKGVKDKEYLNDQINQLDHINRSDYEIKKLIDQFLCLKNCGLRSIDVFYDSLLDFLFMKHFLENSTRTLQKKIRSTKPFHKFSNSSSSVHSLRSNKKSIKLEAYLISLANSSRSAYRLVPYFNRILNRILMHKKLDGFFNNSIDFRFNLSTNSTDFPLDGHRMPVKKINSKSQNSIRLEDYKWSKLIRRKRSVDLLNHRNERSRNEPKEYSSHVVSNSNSEEIHLIRPLSLSQYEINRSNEVYRNDSTRLNVSQLNESESIYSNNLLKEKKHSSEPTIQRQTSQSDVHLNNRASRNNSAPVIDSKTKLIDVKSFEGSGKNQELNLTSNSSNRTKLPAQFPATQTNEDSNQQLNEDFDSNSNYSSFDNDDGPVYYPNPEEILEPWVQNAYFFPIIITYIISFIVGVTGNMLVIFLMLAKKENRNVTTLFLVSLSFSDLLLLIIYGPLEIINYFVLKWDKEGTICRLSSFAESVSAFGSLLNLVAVTLERFVVIVFPIQSRTLCAMHNCKRVLAGVWILAFFLALPMVFIKTTTKTSYTNYNITVNVYYCKELNDLTTFSVYVYRFLTMFIIPSMIMIACYTWVIKELWISTKNLNNIQSNITSHTCSSFEMNTLLGNKNDQSKGKQSRSRKLVNGLNNNVTNLKKKLTSNLAKHCRMNRRTNQETSFIDCENQAKNDSKENIIYLTKRNESSDQQKSNRVSLDRTSDNECIQEWVQSTDFMKLDHNGNHKTNKTEDKNANTFNAEFKDGNLDGCKIKECDTKSICDLTKNVEQANNKIINEFIVFTNKLTTDSANVRTNAVVPNIPANNSASAENSINSKTKEIKNYYNCPDKLLDASTLAYSTARTQPITCMIDDEQRSARSNRNQLITNRNTNTGHASTNLQSQSKVVLRRHMRKEAMDVKSARKQVIKMLILIVALFLICWGPRLMMEMIIKCCLQQFNHVTYALRIIFYLLPFIHSCLNPIVYTFMSTKFRTQLINIWNRIWNKKFGKKKSTQERQYSSRQTTCQSENCTTKIITLDT